MMRPFSSSGSVRSKRPNSKSPSKLFVDSEIDDNEEAFKDPRGDLLSPGWKKPDDRMIGYMGHEPTRKLDPSILDSPLKKEKIGGYTGFIPQSKTICGVKIIPFSPPKTRNDEENQYYTVLKTSKSPTKFPVAKSDSKGFRNFSIHLDIEERYEKAVHLLKREKNQTQEQLLNILQAKLSDQLQSYAQQTIRTRKLFEFYDTDNDGLIDENEFRDCLETHNIQFDDVQALSLFALFDSNKTGFIEYNEFAKRVMIHNPRGGNAVLPKMITSPISFKNDKY